MVLYVLHGERKRQFQKNNGKFQLRRAVVGLVIGEAASMTVSLIAVKLHFDKVYPWNTNALRRLKPSRLLPVTRQLLSLAIPLSMNRIIINFLQSIEAIFIPQKLLAYGYDTTTAL